MVYYNLLLSTNKVANENSKIEVDVQIAILKFLKVGIICALPYDLNNYLSVNLDFIISLASMMHVTSSNSHDLHHMYEKTFIAFLKFETKSEVGIRYLICKQTLR